MADGVSTEGASSSQVTGESMETTEIRIKTLDSKIYTFPVNKDMSVRELKEKLVDATGLPVQRQKLIFRGKVLKDDHLLSVYHLEDGHTLHLVERQPIEGQSSSGTNSERTVQDNDSQENASTFGVPRNRVGQVSHSVLLGTVNVADQGESMAADIGRVGDIGRLVGAVLNSLGVGTGAPTGSAIGTPSATVVPSSAEAERNQNASGNHVSGNPSLPGFMTPNQLFQSGHQIPQFPLSGILSPQVTIPDSLTTLSEFISRMELSLQNGGSNSSNNVHDPLRTESQSSSTRGLPTPETLRMVMEQARQLLRGNASAALSRVGTRLERDGTSTDTGVRGEIQAEAMHVGAAMQHLGAFLLELGRTIMTLRMGQSPADSAVNAGPAVYISPLGPNPIMVQPFPLQTNSLFGASPPSLINGVPGPIPAGDPSRNVSIHIHAGTPFTPGVANAANRPSSGEAVHGEQRTNAQQPSRDGNMGDASTIRGLPARTVAVAIPARPNAQTSGHVLSVIYPVQVRSQITVPIHSAAPQVSNPTASSGTQPSPIPVSQPSSQPGTLSSIIAQISEQVVNALAGGAQGLGPFSQRVQSPDAQGSQLQSGLASQVVQTPSDANFLSADAQRSTVIASTREAAQEASPGSLSLDLTRDDVNGQAGTLDTGSVFPDTHGGEEQKLPQESSDLCSTEGSSIDANTLATTSLGGLPAYRDSGEASNDKSNEQSDSVVTSHAAQLSQGSDSDRHAPLGLGLGGLQPKRRVKTVKSVAKDRESHETPPVNQDQQSISRGQQLLQSLVSQSSGANSASTIGPSNPQTSLIGERQGTNGQGQLDLADMMSNIVRNPVFSNLLNGVDEQTGIASPSDFRSILEQCTQSPAIRNTLNDIAQQVGQPQRVGRGQSGLDISRMIQQMMPAMSQALGRSSIRSPTTPSMQLSSDTRPVDGGSGRDETLSERNSPVDVERAVERIEQHDTPGNVFRSVLESAGHLVGEGNNVDDLVNTLGTDEELTNGYMTMLYHDIHRRTQTDSASED